MYREYKQKLAEKDTPPFRMSRQHGSFPVGKHTRMAEREKLDVLSLLREGLKYGGTGASHVFVILGASVSTHANHCRELTCTCIPFFVVHQSQSLQTVYWSTALQCASDRIDD